MPGAELEHAFDLFGTRVRVLVGATQAFSATARLDLLRVQARLQTIHRTLTRFDTDSELSRLNARTGEELPVSATLLHAVQAALLAARASDGLVDPTLLGSLEGAGYPTTRVGLSPTSLVDAIAAAPARRPAAARPADWASIRVDSERGTVRLPHGVRIDLGGTAKGLAADIGAELLTHHASFAIDVGGDIRFGGTDGRERTVQIAHPLRDGVACSLALTSGAVATSGLRTRVWRAAGGFAHHLIDPARGTPAWTGVIQATALADTALEAETLAKTALLRGPQRGREVLGPGGGVLILDDGQLVPAGNLESTTPRPSLAA